MSIVVISIILGACSAGCLIVSIRRRSLAFSVVATMAAAIALVVPLAPRFSIDVQLYLLSGGLAVLGLVAAAQSLRLRKIYRSRSSWIGAFAFLLLAGRQVYALYRLKANLAEARRLGYMIDHLSVEQWIVGVLWPYAILASFVIWQHWQHREFKKFGV